MYTKCFRSCHLVTIHTYSAVMSNLSPEAAQWPINETGVILAANDAAPFPALLAPLQNPPSNGSQTPDHDAPQTPPSNGTQTPTSGAPQTPPNGPQTPTSGAPQTPNNPMPQAPPNTAFFTPSSTPVGALYLPTPPGLHSTPDMPPTPEPPVNFSTISSTTVEGSTGKFRIFLFYEYKIDH